MPRIQDVQEIKANIQKAHDWYRQQEDRYTATATDQPISTWYEGYYQGLAMAYKHAQDMLRAYFPEIDDGTRALSQEPEALVGSTHEASPASC